MSIASPALAQEATPPADTQTQGQTPVTEPASPAAEAPQSAEAPKPEASAPAQTAAQPAPATPAEPAPGQRATQESQVAAVVNAEFANYDKDGNGALDQVEFGAWMVALRVKAEPAFVAESPEGKAWVAAAFKQADADKNTSVNATELTTFLTPKPAA